MASFVIHLAIAKEYLIKNNNNENIEEFKEGSIAPDLANDKSISHYGFRSANPNLYDYLKKNNVKNSYDRGYFMHLFTDLLFYHYFIHIDELKSKLGPITWKKFLYNDYDIVNSKVIAKYKLDVPEKIKDKMSSKEGKMELFTLSSLYEFIDRISDIDLDKVIKKVMENETTDIIDYFIKNY